MRRHKSGYKMAAAILAATVVISGIPTAAMTAYGAERDVAAEDNEVVISEEIMEETASDHAVVNQSDGDALGDSAADDKFNENGSLKDGTYTLPIAMMNAGNHANASMAASCVKGAATLEVKDGVSTVTMDVQPVSVFGITGWASNWTVYQANACSSTTETIEADTHKDADGNVDQVIFQLPGTNADGAYQWGGVYLGMYVAVMDMNTQGWFSMDFANAELQNTEPAEPTYGSGGTKLAAGTYDLPVGLMNASDITSPSMAAAVVQGASLTVAEDGTATVTVKLTSLTMMGMTVWAKDWKIYQTADKSDTPVDAEAHTNEDGNVDSITFTVPDNSWDGVYVNMNSGRASDAYLAFDYAQATVPAPVPTFGSARTELKAGTYSLPISLMNATNPANPSMAASCIKDAILTVAENGSGEITVNLNSVTVGTISAWATDWKVYQTADKSDTPVAATEHKNEDGNVDSITFAVSDNSWDGIYVNMYIDVMGTAPDAYLALDYAKATVYTEPTPTPEPTDTPEPTPTETPKPTDTPEPTPTETPNPTDTPTPTPEISKPATPSSVKAVSAAYNKVKVTWKKVSDADGYQVYQYNNTAKKYKLVKTVTAASYTKGSLKTGTRYTFKVRSYKTVDGKKVYSAFSKTVSAKPILTKVKGLKATNVKNRTAKVTWKKVSGASGYVIYRAAKKNGTYKKVTTIKKGSTTTYSNKKLTTGKTCYYKVRAYRTVNGKKVYSSYSKIVSVKIKK